MANRSPLLGRAFSPFLKKKHHKNDNEKGHLEKHSENEDREEIKYFALRNFKTNVDGCDFTVAKGEEIHVVQKLMNGWWFVKVGEREGRIPSNYVQTQFTVNVKNKTVNTDKFYITGEDYEAIESSCISFKKGELVTIIDKVEGSWWYASINGIEGWVPSTYLDKIDSSSNHEVKKGAIQVNSDSGNDDVFINTENKGTHVTAAPKKASNIKDNPIPSNDKPKKPTTPVTKRKKQNMRERSIDNENMSAKEISLVKNVNTNTENNSNHELATPKTEGSLEEIPNDKPKQPTTPVPKRKTKGIKESSIDNENSILKEISTAKNANTENKGPYEVKTLKKESNNEDKPKRPTTPIPERKTKDTKETKSEKTKNNEIPIKFKKFIEGCDDHLELYVALADYIDHDEGVLCFKRNNVIKIHVKDDEGWWLAEYEGQHGWVPSNYLKRKKHLSKSETVS